MKKKPRASRGEAMTAVRGSGDDAKRDPGRRRVWTGLLVAAGLALVMQGVEYWGWFAGTEGRVLDLFLNLRPAGKQTPGDAPVIIIRIDDAAYNSCFGGTPPLDPTLLKQIVWSLVTGDTAPGSRVLGVDIITDSKGSEYRNAYQQIDTGLRDLSHSGKLVTPVVWAAGAEVSVSQGSSLAKWLLGTEDELLVQPTAVLGIKSSRLPQPATGASASDPWDWGLPVFPPDEDLRLRRFPRKLSVIFADDSSSNILTGQASWARKIAERFGAPLFDKETNGNGSSIIRGGNERFEAPKIDNQVREVLLSYSIPYVADYTLGELYHCETNGGKTKITVNSAQFNALTDKVHNFHNAALLLGGTFGSSSDFHETSQGRLSGLDINARAVQAELAGHPIREFPRLLMFVLDTVIGFVIGFMFEPRGWRIKVLFWASLGVLLVVVLLSYAALWLGYWWLSCVGVALGVNVHVIYEVYKMDLRAPRAEH